MEWRCYQPGKDTPSAVVSARSWPTALEAAHSALWPQSSAGGHWHCLCHSDGIWVYEGLRQRSFALHPFFDPPATFTPSPKFPEPPWCAPEVLAPAPSLAALTTAGAPLRALSPRTPPGECLAALAQALRTHIPCDAILVCDVDDAGAACDTFAFACGTTAQPLSAPWRTLADFACRTASVVSLSDAPEVGQASAARYASRRGALDTPGSGAVFPVQSAGRLYAWLRLERRIPHVPWTRPQTQLGAHLAGLAAEHIARLRGAA
ncbi:MAG: hypothetical protein M0R76_09140 [Proteobacteria bacterium]|nr:hypothetical protein [Pseudomonadota bacterium]